jgi:hypothetical protein
MSQHKQEEQKWRSKHGYLPPADFAPLLPKSMTMLNSTICAPANAFAGQIICGWNRHNDRDHLNTPSNRRDRAHDLAAHFVIAITAEQSGDVLTIALPASGAEHERAQG